jgi:hypothetical protein
MARVTHDYFWYFILPFSTCMGKAHRPWLRTCERGIRVTALIRCCLMFPTWWNQILHRIYPPSMLMEMERSRCHPCGFLQGIARSFCPPYENMRSDTPNESEAPISRTISSGFSIAVSNPEGYGQKVRGSPSGCLGCTHPQRRDREGSYPQRPFTL